MKADLTRNTFHWNKHYTRVLMQQGRVQIDADWNEQSAILLQTIRTLAADLIGPHGGPDDNLGYIVLQGLPALTPPVVDFGISNGHYYVDGILCTNDPTPIAITEMVTGKQQVRIEAWTVGGSSFAVGQLVEVFGASDPSFTTLAYITNVSQAERLLTLDEDVSGFT